MGICKRLKHQKIKYREVAKVMPDGSISVVGKVEEKINPLGQHIELLKRLNLDKKLTDWYYFDKLKRINQVVINKKLTDRSGGKLQFNQSAVYAENLDISQRRFSQLLNKWIEYGWVKKYNTCYVMVSWKRIAELYDLHNIRKRPIKGDTKKEFLTNFAYTAIKSNHRQQVYEHFRKLQETEGKQSSRLIITEKRKYAASKEVSTSCRQLVKQLGYRSAKTGSRVLLKLAKLKLVAIEKVNEYLCKAHEYMAFVKGDKSLVHKCYGVRDNVYQRKRSNVSVISFI